MTDKNPALHFVHKMALRNAVKLVRGFRKQIGHLDEDVIVGKLLDELQTSSFEIRCAVRSRRSAGWDLACAISLAEINAQ
jgi:hypothetical protein